MKKTTSFRTRLTWYLIVLSAGCMSLLSIAFLGTAIRTIRGHFEEMAVDATRISANYLVQTGRLDDVLSARTENAPNPGWQTFLGSISDDANIVAGDRAVLYDESGTLILRLSRYDNAPRTGQDAPELSARVAASFYGKPTAPIRVLPQRGGLWIGVPVPTPDRTPNLVLFVHYPMGGAARLTSLTTVYVAGLACLLVVAAVILAAQISRYMARPLGTLFQAAQQIGSGDLTHRIDTSLRDEFGEIAHAFNQMASSLQRQMQNVRVEAQRREQLETEFRIAAHIQQALLPAELPEMEALELAAVSRPARQVGGDFYDVCRVGENAVYFAVGDATNKGLPAAVHITECASAVRALAKVGLSPSRILNQVNDQLYEELGDSCRFVTLFLAKLDLESLILTYSVAGHNPPVLLRDTPEIYRFLNERSGLPLGVSDQAAFDNAQVQLTSGDTLLLYTDGLTEASNPDGELLGTEAVVETLQEHQGASAPSAVDALLARVEDHDEGEQSDDLTVVLARLA